MSASFDPRCSLTHFARSSSFLPEESGNLEISRRDPPHIWQEASSAAHQETASFSVESGPTMLSSLSESGWGDLAQSLDLTPLATQCLGATLDECINDIADCAWCISSQMCVSYNRCQGWSIFRFLFQLFLITQCIGSLYSTDSLCLVCPCCRDSHTVLQRNQGGSLHSFQVHLDAVHGFSLLEPDQLPRPEPPPNPLPPSLPHSHDSHALQ